MASTLKDRVSSRLHSLGINPFEASRRGGLERNFVNDILNLRKKTVLGNNLKKLAKALECTESDLLSDRTFTPISAVRGARRIPIIGMAEAGAFREMSGFDDVPDDDLPHISAPASRLYPDATHFAVEVRGDSMNAARPTPILDGMIALCVDVASADIPIESGKIYAVRQTRDGGQTYELTIKRAKVFRTRIELHPESSNPKHEKLTIPIASVDASTNEVKAIGLVYFAGYDFER